MTDKINKDVTIGKLVKEHPETAEVLFQHGFHCIGCPASQMESIEEGAKAHGMDDKGVEELVGQLNAAAEKGTGSDKDSEKKEADGDKDGAEKSD